MSVRITLPWPPSVYRFPSFLRECAPNQKLAVIGTRCFISKANEDSNRHTNDLAAFGDSALNGMNTLAPQSGYVSNFRRPNSSVIEPVDGHCFQSDPCELLAGVHGGHPVRTRLELAMGPVFPDAPSSGRKPRG